MAESATPIVEIKSVSKVFQLQDQKIHALSDANLSISKGEFVCLIGASGCGKSTLLRIMAGFEQPSAGQALMWGKSIEGPDPSRGMVFQDYALFPWLSVRDNIGFGPASRGLSRAEVKATVDKFIEGGLLVVRAGGRGGLMSAVIGDWAAQRKKSEVQPVTREIPK